MKKLRNTLVLLIIAVISSWFWGITSFSSASTYADGYQQELKYKIKDWNGTNGVEWYIWDFTDPITRGFAGTEKRGEIIVNITGIHDKPSQLAYLENPDPVPLRDLSNFPRLKGLLA